MAVHPSLADWYRSGGVVPPEGLLQGRWTAVEEAAATADRELLLTLVRVFAVPGANEKDVPDRFREFFRVQDDTFPAKDNFQEMRVLAGALLRYVLEDEY